MDRLLLFIAQEWLLVGTLGLLLILWFIYESRSGGTTISTTALTRYINQGDALLLDVRPQNDFEQGHIASAVNVPHTQLREQINSYRKWQDKPVILVCAYGLHSRGCTSMLKANGFIHVMRLRGGTEEWRRENLPLVT